VSAHPDIPREQNYIDFAYECLDAMRRRAERLIAEELGAGEVDSEIVRVELARRVASLVTASGPLCFGRIDENAGQTFYVGRRHVKDESDRPVVVDWRAGAAAPFYRATIRDSLGLDARRRYLFDDDRVLVDIFEENFLDPSSVAAGHGGVPDPLLAELGRARTGGMRDIVATIQADQDEIIRWPSKDLVVVQGGPGTGKTAVGLHRVAYLLYEHRERLERQGVLVIGPNRIFLEYISAVLPSLGETSVRQTTIEDLFGSRYRVSGSDSAEIATLKGDPRMAALVGRACDAQLRPPHGDLDFRFSTQLVRISAAEARQAFDRARITARDLRGGRTLFTDMLERLAFRAYTDLHPGADEATFISALRREPGFKRARDSIWPSINPARIVAGLLSGGPLLAACANGVLSDAELGLLRKNRRPTSAKVWSPSDLPLLDEAAALIDGPSFVYGHVIVDEAQDLTSMDLRMLGRRSVDGSMTVLGDLAQATRVGAQQSWADAITSLGSPAPSKIFELNLGYRVPAPIMNFANRLLPVAAPNVEATHSVRSEGDDPILVRTSPAALADDAVAVASSMAERMATVGVIVPESVYDAMAETLSASGSDWHEEELGGKLTLLHPAAVKGLEFDGVVVVEPTRIFEEELNGPRMLYITLTRAVQELTIVFSDALPEELAQAATVVG
jgi:DNA helicase IV